MLLHGSSPSDLTVGEYILYSGAYRLAAPERAMLNALGTAHETLATFIERLAQDELPFEMVELYLDAGAFASPAFYPALANLRREHPGAGSLVRRAREGMIRMVENDPQVQEEQTYTMRARSGDAHATDRLRAAMIAYLGSLPPRKQEEFEEIASRLANASSKQHL